MALDRRPLRRRHRAATIAAAAVVGLFVPNVVSAQPAELLPGRPFAPVVEGVVQGDLVLAGNSNVAVDVDGEPTRNCVDRTSGRPLRPPRRLCVDNSSSAQLDVPAGAHVIAARLYVETSVGRNVGPLRVKLDGPSPGHRYVPLPSAPAAPVAGPPKLYEARAGDGAVARQAVWDLTAYVAAAGPGTYTVADIPNERAAPWGPHASWAIVAAYELDPNGAAADPTRFSSRFVSWHDGFEQLASLDIPIGGVDLGAATFGKSLHVVAGGQRGRSDNLVFANEPLGNNAAPDDGPPPAGVQLGSDPPCNTVTDVQNDSICLLGTSVADGTGVDIDVIRIPDRYLRAAGAAAVLQVRATGGDTLAPGVLAVSIDVPEAAS